MGHEDWSTIPCRIYYYSYLCRFCTIITLSASGQAPGPRRSPHLAVAKLACIRCRRCSHPETGMSTAWVAPQMGSSAGQRGCSLSLTHRRKSWKGARALRLGWADRGGWVLARWVDTLETPFPRGQTKRRSSLPEYHQLVPTIPTPPPPDTPNAALASKLGAFA